MKITAEDQSLLSSLIAVTDYSSQKFFIKYPYVEKEVYLNVIRKVLPKKGMGPGQVYSQIAEYPVTYKMLENPEIAYEFIELATKAVLNNILNKMNFHLTDEWARNDRISSNFHISNNSIITFYKAITNSQKGMSIKKNRKSLEKALKQNNLIESFKSKSKSLMLEEYIREILSCAEMK